MLNNIYNASDVYLTTTLGEGWGLTLTEAMATKTPIICPLSTSFIEITAHGHRACALENLIPYCNTVDNIVRIQCDHIEVADNIIHLAMGMNGMLEDINFNENFQKMLDNGYNWTKSLDWKEVCKDWIKYFKDTY